ncbi:hypothetical protein SUGI_1450970 [Cryptomeria japonica]|uniref:Uncharacterized protein n=1 Tax=Cryptomeria japonica TaxID=3369 RepID=A0AAD3RQS7_CRYJA|nr:hypothetical protein SUGI_1450970 [Cryptomeria japonica]
MEWIHFRTEIDEIESILKYSFNNKDLLKEALESYHRLEFFGDAVLEFLIAINVYKTCKEIDKKTFVKLVTINVENDVLGRAALKNKFHNYLLDNAVKNRADKCEEAMADESISNSDVKPPKVLANLIEALVGAVHVDSAFSFEKVWEKFKNLLEPLVTPETLEKHPVSELQELCQKTGKCVMYKEKIVVEVFIDDEMVGRGECTKKEVAKKRAARNALQRQWKFNILGVFVSKAVVVINMREGVTSEDSIGSAKHQPRDHHRLQGTNEWGKQLALRDLIHLHVAERHAIESSHVHNFDLDKEEGQDDQHVSATESVVELCDVESNIVGGQNRDHSKGGLPWM